MALKRTLELTVDNGDEASFEDGRDCEPPAKRRITTVLPHTPLPNKSFPIPQTPFTKTPYPSRPLDSPTNPVGRKRTQTLNHSLPPPTLFSRHLPLRFQFVRPGVSPRLGGIYRIVQVPLNYTFVQLRCLIAFLFGGGYGYEREDRHLFELKKKLTMYAQTYKPGQIRNGFTAAKLSTARDPCRYRPEVDEDIFDDNLQIEEDLGKAPLREDAEEIEDEAQDWSWELEEEFTLGHAWTKGGDLGIGLIYHHNETTAVHITVNTSTLPKRKGKSNIPYVFNARGRVHLFPNAVQPLPKPVFSVPISKLSIPSFRESLWSTGSTADEQCTEDPEDEDADDLDEDAEAEEDADADGDSDPEFGDARGSMFLEPDTIEIQEEDETSSTDDSDEDEGEEEEGEDPNATLNVSKFNEANAFATYLRFAYQHSQQCQYPQSDDSDSDDDVHDRIPLSTPGLVYTSSSPASSSSPLRSSSVALPSSPSASYDHYSASLSTLSTLSTTTFTPAPQHALWQRRRLERMQKRMDKHKKRAWLCMRDEEEEEDNVDQLAEEGKKEPKWPMSNSKFPKKNQPPLWRHKSKPTRKGHVDLSGLRWAKPPLQTEESDIWDSLCDELEV